MNQTALEMRADSLLVICVFVTLSGQQRSRMLATLFKDERCQQLPAYGILEKMYAFISRFYFISNSCFDVTHDCDIYTPWAIKKRATFIFSITLANIDGFS